MSKRLQSDRLAQSVCTALCTARHGHALATLTLLLAGAPALPALAEEPAGEAKTLDAITVISTGTRKANMAVTDSPAPIQLVSAEMLKQSAAPDLINAIANQVPSYNANQTGNDMASQTLTASLRNLSPNHTLVLVNGKRRHITSNVNTTTGAASADLSFIPAAAIDHVEVLTDGAAALYGSDAIAGVINIILKKNHEGGEVDAGYAGYKDGGGGTDSWGANIGFGSDAAYFSLSAEVENRKTVYRLGSYSYADCVANYADCSAVNPSMADFLADDVEGMTLNGRFPNVNAWLNPPEVHRKALFFNSGAVLSDTLEFYAFGSYGKKTAQSEENYRRPSQDGGYVDPATGAVSHKYALGFNPSEASDEVDYELTAGLKGVLADWSWDFSSSYGKNEMDVYTLNSMNFSLWQDYGSSPEDFYDGSFWASQWTTNLNATHDFDVGLSQPLTFNAGIEYRRDQYGIDPGDPTSYYGAGASSFPGYNPLFNTGSYSRHSYAAYADVVFNPTEKWLLDVAGRYENYSDFGSKVVGKLTTRFDLTDTFAVRGTASTGFRAPTLQEGYYSAVQVGPTSATPTLQPNSAAAAALGFGSLKPETSTNYSLGFVFRPMQNFDSTLDFYRITISDRIGVGTFEYSKAGQPGDTNGDGTPDAAYNAALGQALVDFGYLGGIDPAAPGGSLDATARQNISVAIFNNALKTRSSGVDWVTNYITEFDWGSIDWMLAANYNKTEVLSAKPAPEVLGGATMYSAATLINLENNAPKYRVNLGATFNVGKFSLRVTEAVYGPQYQLVAPYDEWNGDIFPDSVLSQLDVVDVNGAPYYKQKIGTMALTNVELTFRPTEQLTVSVGGDNVFNTYPDKIPSAAYDYLEKNYLSYYNSPYLTGSPIGYFGARYYAKLTYRF
ncbi:TonB-dependent receptor plug domain-containing protein [Xanthomonas bundabergensis]|uniref:TonB-dependent receptor plug domain-containing protein n=1 Tax=Xanthomonas bundabergensis TaxID=3160842 RepID=UPI00351614AA